MSSNTFNFWKQNKKPSKIISRILFSSVGYAQNLKPSLLSSYAKKVSVFNEFTVIGTLFSPLYTRKWIFDVICWINVILMFLHKNME